MITYNRQASSQTVGNKVHHYRKSEEEISFSRSALQLVSFLGVIFLLSRAFFSLFGEAFGTQMLIPSYKAYGHEIDQNTRILGGMWLFLSFCILWCLPKIQEQNRATLYRSCMGVLFFGGLGRVISVLTVGAFSPADDELMMALELVLAPILVWWQWCVECQAPPAVTRANSGLSDLPRRASAASTSEKSEERKSLDGRKASEGDASKQD